jgi:hypothetical protein
MYTEVHEDSEHRTPHKGTPTFYGLKPVKDVCARIMAAQ